MIGVRPSDAKDSKAASSAADSTVATASYLFYTNNRALLDSYLVHKFASFSKPLLKVIFASRGMLCLSVVGTSHLCFLNSLTPDSRLQSCSALC